MISIGDLELYLGISAGTDTALLIAIEAEAVDWFSRETGRFFGAAAETTEIVVGDGTGNLYLSEEPVAGESVAVVEQAYLGADQETVTASAADGYEVRDQHLARKGGYAWSSGWEYLVTYTRGYTLTAAAVAGVTPADIAAPDEVRRAIKAIVGFWYHGGAPADGASQKTSETMGNYSYTRGALFSNPDGMLNGIPGLRDTLRHWKEVRI